jgi:hypothetical protein
MEKKNKIILYRDYLCFSINHDKEHAVERFIKRFGEPPKYVIEDNIVLWVGPIQKDNNDK